MRIGVDVGGTNTDAVLMDGKKVVGWFKTPTTADVTTGITTAVRTVLEQSKVSAKEIKAVMIGTTHFTNAVVERRRLTPTAVIRLGLPATRGLPPMIDWPADLRQAIGNHKYLAHGGREFDGREISPLDEAELRSIAKDIKSKGIKAIAISSVFSPVNGEDEKRAAAVILEEIPGAEISLSHEIGRMGLLERENAAILNACLCDLARVIVSSFKESLAAMNIDAPFYLSQNDGTLMSADTVQKYPVLTFASGPTNSMRGAAFLSGLKDAMVVDIGGTTTDVGMLQHGFPREASLAVDIGGVRTNFRMPDVFSIGLGGGTVVAREPLKIGPQSVGYELTAKGMVFGGDTLTATDVVVAGGLPGIGDPAAVKGLDPSFVKAAIEQMQVMIENAVDRMKTSLEDTPLVLVGGGVILVQRELRGASKILRPDHYPVANAIGAAIAQVGGETDRIYTLVSTPRDEALAHAKQEAIDKVKASGADEKSITILDFEEIPLTYLPSNAVRIRVKAVGDLALD